MNAESIKAITSYLKNNYLTIEQLANESNLSVDQLEILIHHACIPKHSHVMTRQVIFQTDIFGKSILTEEKTFYYHPSLINLAIKAAQYLETLNLDNVANKMKSDFIDELRHALVDIEIDSVKQVFDYCFDDDGSISADGVEKFMAKQWQYILDGTYGVCLKEISAKNILLKNIAVSILEKWINGSDQDKERLHDEAQYAAAVYDSVASAFGPHEVLKSTRERLYNQFY